MALLRNHGGSSHTLLWKEQRFVARPAPRRAEFRCRAGQQRSGATTEQKITKDRARTSQEDAGALRCPQAKQPSCGALSAFYMQLRAGFGLKAIWYGAEQFGNIIGAFAGQKDKPRGESPPLPKVN